MVTSHITHGENTFSMASGLLTQFVDHPHQWTSYLEVNQYSMTENLILDYYIMTIYITFLPVLYV